MGALRINLPVIAYFSTNCKEEKSSKHCNHGMEGEGKRRGKGTTLKLVIAGFVSVQLYIKVPKPCGEC